MVTAPLRFVGLAPGFIEILESFVDAVETILESYTDRHTKDVELIDEAVRALINPDAEAVSLAAETVRALSETRDKGRRSNEHESHKSRGGRPDGPVRPVR